LVFHILNVKHFLFPFPKLFPHPAGLPIRHSLRNLAKEHLKIFIQDGDATVGHDSKTDAVSALELVRLKMQQQQQQQQQSDAT
jgi:hypothetical protein